MREHNRLRGTGTPRGEHDERRVILVCRGSGHRRREIEHSPEVSYIGWVNSRRGTEHVRIDHQVRHDQRGCDECKCVSKFVLAPPSVAERWHCADPPSGP